MPTFQLQFPFKFPFNSAPSSTGLDMNVSARSPPPTPPRLFQFPPLIVSFCNLLCRKRQIPYKKISFLSSYLSRTFMLSSILLHSILCFFGTTSAYLDVVLALHSSLLRHESKSNCSAPTPAPEMTRRYLSKPAPTSTDRAGLFVHYRNVTYKHDHVS